MSSVILPLNIPSLEDKSHAPTDLSSRIWAFCKEEKEKRKHEWESIKVALDKMKETLKGSTRNNKLKRREKLPILK